MGKILLCADSESIASPSLIGLNDVVLANYPAIKTVSRGHEAREVALCEGIDEAWIVSSDDFASLNIAAALRADNASLPIYLVAFNPSGSELSRAPQAGVSGVLGPADFFKKFEEAVRGSLSSEKKIAVDCLSTQTCGSGPSFITTFVSGAGGVGKSAVCALSACLCASRGYSTVIVDCDMQFGDMGQVIGASITPTIDDVLVEESALAKLAETTPDGIPAVIAAPGRLERSEELSRHVSSLLAACANCFDAVFVNTGTNWTEMHAQLLEISTCSIFVLDQRASSVRACKHALDLCLRMGIAQNSFLYALNRCGRGAMFTSIDISNALSGSQVLELKDGGDEIEELLGTGNALELAASKNDFCLSIEQMLDEILPEARVQTGGGLFRRRPARRAHQKRREVARERERV